MEEGLRKANTTYREYDHLLDEWSSLQRGLVHAHYYRTNPYRESEMEKLERERLRHVTNRMRDIEGNRILAPLLAVVAAVAMFLLAAREMAIIALLLSWWSGDAVEFRDGFPWVTALHLVLILGGVTVGIWQDKLTGIYIQIWRMAGIHINPLRTARRKCESLLAANVFGLIFAGVFGGA